MRSLVLYFILVVLPLVGVLAILRSGSHLVPPVAINGKWVINKEEGSDRSYCNNLVIVANEPKLSITQSGQWIDIQFNDDQTTAFRGLLQDSQLNTQTVHPVVVTDKNSHCIGNNRLALEATFVKEGEQTKLSGVIKVDGCDSCAPVPFTATRIPAKK